MSILFNSPFPVRDALDEQAKNTAIGQSFASSFLSGFNRGVDQRREDQRWNELAPLREAQLSAANANAQSAVSRSQLEAIQAANAAKQQAKIADFAGLAGEVAERGYDAGDRIRMYEFLKKNPEFYGSPFHQQLEGSFNNAAKARADEEEWRTRIAGQITEERIRQEGRAVPRLGLTEDQRIILRGEISALKEDPKAAVPGWLKGEIDKVAKKYGITAPEVEAIGVDEGGTASSQPPQQTTSNVRKVVKDPNGNLVIEGAFQEPPTQAKAAPPKKRLSLLDIIGIGGVPSSARIANQALVD